MLNSALISDSCVVFITTFTFLFLGTTFKLLFSCVAFLLPRLSFIFIFVTSEELPSSDEDSSGEEASDFEVLLTDDLD